MTDTVALSQLPSGQAIKPASGNLTLDGTKIGSVTPQTGSFTTVSASTPIGGQSGGTNNAFMQFTGPASAVKTYTLPNASSTILTTSTPVTVAQGGTGLATLTANSVLVGNGTGNVGGVAPGNSGNVLTSNGTTWASSAPVAGGGGWSLLSTQSASTSASIAFNSTFITTTYKNYVVLFNNIVLATNSAVLGLYFSIDNGSNYITSGIYQHLSKPDSSSASYSGQANTANNYFQITGSVSNLTSISGQIFLYDPTEGTGSYKGITSAAAVNTSGPVGGFHSSGGFLSDTTAINNIKFQSNSGNITSGTFKLYGIS